MPVKQFMINKKIVPIDLINYINRNNIEVVHINTSVFSNILRPIKERTNAKVIVHLREMLPHGLGHIVDRFIIENTINYSDAIIAISPNELRFFNEARKTYVLPNPHPFEETDRMLLNKKKTDRIIIGMVAGFLPYKGHIDFIKAAIEIVNRTGIGKSELEFRIVGYPKKELSVKSIAKKILKQGYKREFDNALAKSGIEHYFKIIPHTFDVFKELLEFSIYVRPDNTGHPWGRDIIEAMAMQLPVVATGTSSFFVKDGVNGFLCRPNCPVEIADAIINLISERNRIKTFGKMAYETVNPLCNLDVYGKKLTKIYQEL